MKEHHKKLHHYLSRINDVLQNYEWGDSGIIRLCHKKLVSIRDQIQHHLNFESEKAAEDKANVVNNFSNLVPVYIVLFQLDGQNIMQWEKQLGSLKEYCAGRPIYREKKDALSCIAQKANKKKEACIRLYVAEAMILKQAPGLRPYDRWGVELLTLGATAFDVSRVDAFIHGGDDYYDVKNGRLIKQV